MEKYGIRMLKRTKPILSDLGTYLTKVPSIQHRPKATSSILYLEGNAGEENNGYIVFICKFQGSPRK
jgi:hypothetical protein